jgi:nitroreductase
MDVFEAIRARRSVRSYADRSVEEEKLQQVLEAGRLAPSARNLQKWKFVVVRDDDLRKRIADAAEQPFLAEAPLLIALVSCDPDRKMYCGVPAGPVDCAIAQDHMTLAATALGLGTCWIGHFDQDATCRMLEVPPTARIIELMPLGYPAESPAAKGRKPLAEIVSSDRFE